MSDKQKRTSFLAFIYLMIGLVYGETLSLKNHGAAAFVFGQEHPVLYSLFWPVLMFKPAGVRAPSQAINKAGVASSTGGLGGDEDAASSAFYGGKDFGDTLPADASCEDFTDEDRTYVLCDGKVAGPLLTINLIPVSVTHGYRGGGRLGHFIFFYPGNTFNYIRSVLTAELGPEGNLSKVDEMTTVSWPGPDNKYLVSLVEDPEGVVLLRLIHRNWW
jgi:hypothetical protein